MYGGIFSNKTGLLITVDSYNNTVSFYDTNYTQSTSLSFSLNRTYDRTNKPILSNIKPGSVQIDSQDRLYILDAQSPNLLILEPGNGYVLINTGTGHTGTADLMTIKPDGSVIYVPDGLKPASIVAIQGIN